MTEIKESKETLAKDEINEKHLRFYAKVYSMLDFMLDEFSRELTRADIEFLEIPKGVSGTLDFLISSISKVQKGERLATGIEDGIVEHREPQFNIIEGLNEEKL